MAHRAIFLKDKPGFAARGITGDSVPTVNLRQRTRNITGNFILVNNKITVSEMEAAGIVELINCDAEITFKQILG
jgi:hypothetical protein